MADIIVQFFLIAPKLRSAKAGYMQPAMSNLAQYGNNLAQHVATLLNMAVTWRGVAER